MGNSKENQTPTNQHYTAKLKISKTTSKNVFIT